MRISDWSSDVCSSDLTMAPPTEDRWHIWIDRGGTFTDVVARRPDGGVVTAKYLSEDPARAGDAAVGAIRDLTGAGAGPLPPLAIRMGSTVATNALLERKGAPTLLAITRGFGDADRKSTRLHSSH